jgi:hypothetical protein
MTNGSVSLLLFFESYATPKIVQVRMKDYALAFGEFHYEQDTIHRYANSYHSSVA